MKYKKGQMVRVKVSGKIFVGRYGMRLTEDAGPRINSVYWPLQDAYCSWMECGWFTDEQILGLSK